MSLLFLRMIELKEEYFNKLTLEDLCLFHDSLNEHIKYYSSDLLISMMAAYEDEKYPKVDNISDNKIAQ